MNTFLVEITSRFSLTSKLSGGISFDRRFDGWCEDGGEGWKHCFTEYCEFWSDGVLSTDWALQIINWSILSTNVTPPLHNTQKISENDTRSAVLTSYRFQKFLSQFKVDRLQIIVVAKTYISTCRNCSSVGCLKCVQFHNWFRLH